MGQYKQNIGGGGLQFDFALHLFVHSYYVLPDNR